MARDDRAIQRAENLDIGDIDVAIADFLGNEPLVTLGRPGLQAPREAPARSDRARPSPQ